MRNEFDEWIVNVGEDSRPGRWEGFKSVSDRFHHRGNLDNIARGREKGVGDLVSIEHEREKRNQICKLVGLVIDPFGRVLRGRQTKDARSDGADAFGAFDVSDPNTQAVK